MKNKKKKKEPGKVFYTIDDPAFKSRLGNDLYAEPINGRVYRANEKVTSFYGDVKLSRGGEEVERLKASIKSASGFGNNLPLAYQALDEWRRRKYGGSPFSCASFVRAQFNRKKAMKEFQSRCNASVNNVLRPHFTGGWQEARCRGYIYEPVYLYDINSAYMHAASMGLPKSLYPYTGKNNPLGYVVIVEPTKLPRNMPEFFYNQFKYKGKILLTSEEQEYYNIDGRVVGGCQYYNLDVNLLEILYDICELPPQIFKRCTQSFWGMFASGEGVDVETLDNKSQWKLYNRNQNYAWASLILRRVVTQVHELMVKLDGISCFVDSVLTTKKISPELFGDDVGKWKESAYYPKGVYIESPGVYNALPFKTRSHFKLKKTWTKHAGTKNA